MSQVIPAESSHLEDEIHSDDAEYSSVSSFDEESIAEATSPVQRPVRQLGQLYTKDIHLSRESDSHSLGFDVVHVFTTLMDEVPADSGDVFKHTKTKWMEFEYQMNFSDLLLGSFSEKSLQNNAYALLDGLNQKRQGIHQVFFLEHRLTAL
jgi:hypothetical protein